MDENLISKKIKKLEKDIEKHNNLYYNLNSPKITDYEYDLLKKELTDLQKKFANKSGEFDLFGEPIIKTKIGSLPSRKFKKIAHEIPMLSLENAFNKEEFFEFDKKVKRSLKLEENFKIEYVAELKIDGLSFSALYKNGDLKYVCTRGDGVIGEDITNNAKCIKDFPLKLNCKNNLPNLLEVRGEIYLSNKNFEILNENQAKNGEKIFSNPRNAASGTLRNLDPKVTESRNLEYFAYNVTQIDKEFLPKKQSECLNLLHRYGFNINKNFFISDKLDEIIDFYKKISENRYKIEFDVDGLVYKINEIELQSKLGSTNQSPRWAIANKFEGNYGTTKIQKIIHQVGRLGNITPVAELLPINIGGVVVGKATLHNYEEIKRLNICEGDIVKILRAGDVVPKVVEVVEKINNNIEDSIPKHCPCCGFELQKDEELVALKCNNSENCKDQIIQRIGHFISRDAMNIVGFGEKQILKFYNAGLIKGVLDIFFLKNKKYELSNLDGVGMKSIENLIDSIEKSKDVKLEKLLYGLSIKYLGLGSAKLIANEVSVNDLMNLNESNIEKIRSIKGIGEKILNEIIDYFSKEKNINIFSEIINQVKIT